MMQQKMTEELKAIGEKEESKSHDIGVDMQKSNKGLGNKRLGQVLSAKVFQRDIKDSSKFRKIEKQTMMKLMAQVDKYRVKEVVISLRDHNRKLQEEAGLKDTLDDSLHFVVDLDKNIEVLNETTRISALGGFTLVELPVQNDLVADDCDVLVITKDKLKGASTKALLNAFAESSAFGKKVEDESIVIGSVPDILDIIRSQEAKQRQEKNRFKKGGKLDTSEKPQPIDVKNKNSVKRYLAHFDYIFVDSKLNLLKLAKELGIGVKDFMRKKKFPFPVKLSGAELTPAKAVQNVEESLNGKTHFLLEGGKRFVVECGRTESLTVKENVQNCIRLLLKVVSLIIYSQETHQKHNFVRSVHLETSKSIPIPIY